MRRQKPVTPAGRGGRNRRLSAIHCLLGVFVSLLVVSLGQADDNHTALNVRDHGASGSDFETTAITTAGSEVIIVKDSGDFEVGQEISVSRCHPHLEGGLVWGNRKENAPHVPMKDLVEARGYDGSAGNWTVYILDLAPGTAATFRWSDDLAQTWKGQDIPITGEWQKLDGGVEVRFGKHDWESGHVITFSGRDQLVSKIKKKEGNRLTLADATPVAVKDAVIRHLDTGALQAAFDRAVKEGRNVYIPSGRYRLTGTLLLNKANGITVRGENPETTILDISQGVGSCLRIRYGTAVTLRNLRFVGHSGFAERKQMGGGLGLKGAPAIWGFYLKSCAAVNINSPERVLIENCHATKMSGECFYSSSDSRSGNSEPESYTKSIVYRHCTVTDCARNAFNNNDMAENTAVLYCRIQNVGGCSWEGASRFVKIVGNYIRNAGTVAIGNIRSRSDAFDILPSGQHLVAHNVFEEQMVYGSAAIRSSAGAREVAVCDNLFVNWNTTAIVASGYGDRQNLPAGNTTIRGNIIDLTCVRDHSQPRIGIDVSADDTIISDNQIYVRGEADPNVTGVLLTEPAQNLIVHDNLIRNCGAGLRTARQAGVVSEIINKRTFASGGQLPWPRRRTHCYRDWQIVWLEGGKAVPGPRIAEFDADAGQFKLATDAELNPKAMFEVFNPQGPNWNIHNNIVTDCQRPVSLNSYGGPTAIFADNIITRGITKEAPWGVETYGAFRILGNHFTGFNERGRNALLLHADRFGNRPRIICANNIFEQCVEEIGESIPGLREAAIKNGNLFVDTTDKPTQKTIAPAEIKP